MARTLTLVTVLAAMAGGSHKKADGLAPATDWSADRAEMIPPGAGPSAPSGSPHDPHVAIGGGDPNDPHAGIDMGAAAAGPGGAGGGGADPHAGVDMGAAHAGVDLPKIPADAVSLYLDTVVP